MMQVNPRRVSQSLASPMCTTTLVSVSRKPDDENESPRRPFSCDTAMITEVAEVKPTVTGIEMKSIKTPKQKSYTN